MREATGADQVDEEFNRHISLLPSNKTWQGGVIENRHCSDVESRNRVRVFCLSIHHAG